MRSLSAFKLCLQFVALSTALRQRTLQLLDCHTRLHRGYECRDLAVHLAELALQHRIASSPSRVRILPDMVTEATRDLRHLGR